MSEDYPLLAANVELREQRDAARADHLAVLEEVTTLSLRVQRLEREAQVLYELLCKASENAQEQARTTVAQTARAAALRRERFGQ